MSSAQHHLLLWLVTRHLKDEAAQVEISMDEGLAEVRDLNADLERAEYNVSIRPCSAYWRIVLNEMRDTIECKTADIDRVKLELGELLTTIKALEQIARES